MTDLSKLINMESVQMINPTTILITNKIIMYMFIRVRMNKNDLSTGILQFNIN